MVPSVTDLPLKRHICSDKFNAADHADLEEEKRLMFVACTRAKKRLIVFTGPREKAIMERTMYTSSYKKMKYIYEKDLGLDKYYLSYNAFSRNYWVNDYLKNIDAQTHVKIVRVLEGAYYSYNIFTQNGIKLGRLSRNSNIVKSMERFGISTLSGFFLSDVIAYTYDQSVAFDGNNGTNYSQYWCDEAMKKGYVYIPIISGMGYPEG